MAILEVFEGNLIALDDRLIAHVLGGWLARAFQREVAPPVVELVAVNMIDALRLGAHLDHVGGLGCAQEGTEQKDTHAGISPLRMLMRTICSGPSLPVMPAQSIVSVEVSQITTLLPVKVSGVLIVFYHRLKLLNGYMMTYFGHRNLHWMF